MSASEEMAREYAYGADGRLASIASDGDTILLAFTPAGDLVRIGEPRATAAAPPEAAAPPVASAVASRFCTTCGTPRDGGARFCTKCGTAFVD